ncbi:unnamed protein product [Sphenostylis stenocarpa]|uniref:RING-type E3 ubiquitin transferase n=1 Tax=Sphenostylis stenocarpa TaxID=92480 RepID=A0AA86RR76_9FABA|nr:unnamed protein product [Sphenostylis stenocarpa]
MRVMSHKNQLPLVTNHLGLNFSLVCINQIHSTRGASGELERTGISPPLVFLSYCCYRFISLSPSLNKQIPLHSSSLSSLQLSHLASLRSSLKRRRFLPIPLPSIVLYYFHFLSFISVLLSESCSRSYTLSVFNFRFLGTVGVLYAIISTYSDGVIGPFLSWINGETIELMSDDYGMFSTQDISITCRSYVPSYCSEDVVAIKWSHRMFSDESCHCELLQEIYGGWNFSYTIVIVLIDAKIWMLVNLSARKTSCRMLVLLICNLLWKWLCLVGAGHTINGGGCYSDMHLLLNDIDCPLCQFSFWFWERLVSLVMQQFMVGIGVMLHDSLFRCEPMSSLTWNLFDRHEVEGALSVSVDRGMGKWLQWKRKGRPDVIVVTRDIEEKTYSDHTHLTSSLGKTLKTLRSDSTTVSILTERFQVTVMGHRHFYNTSPLFEGEPDQNWNHMHTDQQNVHLGRTSTSENGSFAYPADNMSIDGISFPSHWNSSTRSNGYASSGHNIDVPPHQSDASGTSNDHFVHSSSAGAFFTVSENYVHQPSSSNYDRQTFHVDGGFVDLTMGSGQGPHKRKSPGIPPVYERGSTSRYFNAGSSTDLPISSELWQEKPSNDSQYMPWDHFTMTSTFRGTGLSIKGESFLRNVRSRTALDLDSNLTRSHLSTNHSHDSYPTLPPVDHSSLVDISGQTSATMTRDWSQMNISPTNGRVLLSDTSAFAFETSHFPVGSGATASNASVDFGCFHHEFGANRNPTPPRSFQNNQTQTARGIQSNYSQRSTPTLRASSSLRLGHVTSLDDGLPMVAESYSSRHPRPLSTLGWRNGDRNGRSRISSQRYRSLIEESGLHERSTSEGFLLVERASVYGSRNMLDQHREMRMDIDNMSYEDLLALGERIGYVNTGLSEDLFSKCLMETIYCSSELGQDEGNCVICLEEYKNMDDVGTLKTCGHDYHVSCIKKWLSMKKLCPICKSSALADDTKDK